MNKENRNTIIAITAVALIIVLVGGGTYAWLTWRSGNNTNINIQVGGIGDSATDFKFDLDGGGNITSSDAKKLAPTDQCNHSTYAIQRTLTFNVNNPTTTAFKGYLQIKPTTFPTVFKSAHLHWLLSSSATNCTTASNIIAQGDFSSATQGTAFTLTSFDIAAGTAAAPTAMTKTYYLYIWIDEDYSVENVGNTVTSSMQDKTFTLQATGEYTNNPNAS